MFFFFFKQKTAYEMRISDWSSDVCSSDLVAARTRAILRRLLGIAENADARTGWQVRLLRTAGGKPEAGQDENRERQLGDRKSVVEGKSVSVRVDLGGRRIIKKKQETT